jgi:hypothetical protein
LILQLVVIVRTEDDNIPPPKRKPTATAHSSKSKKDVETGKNVKQERPNATMPPKFGSKHAPSIVITDSDNSDDDDNTYPRSNGKPTAAGAASASANSASSGSADDIGGLPEFARAAWVTRFLPTLYHRLGSALKPFGLANEKEDMVQVVQKVVDYVYPHSGYSVKHGDKIFTMVSVVYFHCS